jgi:hypothetical protein
MFSYRPASFTLSLSLFKIEQLHDDSERLSKSANTFHKNSRKLKRKLRWDDMKVRREGGEGEKTRRGEHEREIQIIGCERDWKTGKEEYRKRET